MSRRLFPRSIPVSYAAQLATALIAAVALTGCSSKKVEGRKDVFPARGKLLVDDQPVAGAMLVLHPVGGAYDAEHPVATVAADGSFELTTYEGNDGAPPGEYIVTVEWHVSVNKDAPGPWPNVIPPKYATPASSDLRVHIAAGQNDLQSIVIRR